MRGTVRQDIGQRLPDLPVPSIDLTPLRVYGILGSTLILGVLAAAGVLSGIGLFILMMIQMDVLGVVLSSLLLTTSLTIVSAIYLWLTPE